MKNSIYSTRARAVVVCVMGFILVLATIILTSCGKDIIPTPVPTLPVVSTTDVTNLTTTSVTTGGNVSSDGNALVTLRGVCFGLSSNPTISDSKTTDGVGIGNFASTLNGLTPGATYNVRAYATNSVGTGYGNNVSFNTIPLMYNVTISSGQNGTTSITGVKQFAAKTSVNITLTPAIGYMVDAVNIDNISYPLTSNNFSYIVDKDGAILVFTFKVDIMWMLTQKPWKTTMEQKRLLGTTSWTNFYPPQVPIHTFVFNNTYKMQEYDQDNKLIGDVNYTLKQDSLIYGTNSQGENGIRNKIITLTQDSLVLRSISKFYIHFPDIRDPSRDIEIQRTLKN